MKQTSHWRRETFWRSRHEPFDVVVVGGGIQGACVYHRLARAGHRVLLIDRGDFASGTSQASANLIWGGLLYLRNLDVLEVVRLSRSRDHLVRALPQWVQPHQMRYICGNGAGRSVRLVELVMWIYWAMGGFRRRRPRLERSFAEGELLIPPERALALAFEEAQLAWSDASFVLRWIRGGTSSGGVAVNYCALDGGGFDSSQQCWRLELRDTHGANEQCVEARWLINAAGTQADALNDRFGISSPFRHRLSKGVSFSVARPPLHRDTLIFDSRRGCEGLSLVPWGPVSLWGSTETPVRDLQQTAVEARDLDFLLDELNRHLVDPVAARQIISLRCGIRPLVVRRGQEDRHPLRLSRRCRILLDGERPWMSIYGGKITSAAATAGRVHSLLVCRRRRSQPARTAKAEEVLPPQERFAGLDWPVVSPRWSVEHDQCLTLEDYLRRRTNIAQWIPRGGLGVNNEHRGDLLQIARVFSSHNGTTADELVRAYDERMREQYDRPLGISSPVLEQSV